MLNFYLRLQGIGVILLENDGVNEDLRINIFSFD